MRGLEFSNMANTARERGPSATRVADNLQALRRARQLTLADVADRVSALGQPMSLGILSKIENGDRRVDVDDLVALAVALGVTPNRLLLPASAGDDELQLTPERECTERQAWAWAAGDRPLIDREPGETHEDGLDLDLDDPLFDEFEAFARENRPHVPRSTATTADHARWADHLRQVDDVMRQAETAGVPTHELTAWVDYRQAVRVSSITVNGVRIGQDKSAGEQQDGQR